jgi:hypothetical protein
MLRFLVAVAVVGSSVAIAAPPASAPAEAEPRPQAGDWRTLFNGRDLSGWDGDPRMWTVRDGVIHGETTPDVETKGNTFLICKAPPLRDFELTLRYRCNAANNSGVQYRSRHITDDTAKNAWVVRGYQHELRNEAVLPNVSGFIYDEGGKRGRICLVGEQAEWVDGTKQVTGHLLDADAFAKLFKLDDWNEVRIVAQGARLRHYLNGTLTLDFTDAPELAIRDGIVALQLHAGKPMWVEFKDVAVRDLAPAP